MTDQQFKAIITHLRVMIVICGRRCRRRDRYCVGGNSVKAGIRTKMFGARGRQPQYGQVACETALAFSKSCAILAERHEFGRGRGE